MTKVISGFKCALKEIEPHDTITAQEFENGPKVDPIRLIITYTSDDWETFIDEWVHSLKDTYSSVMRPTGPGDKGIDVAGFTDDQKLDGIWDNHQCKHYGSPSLVLLLQVVSIISSNRTWIRRTE